MSLTESFSDPSRKEGQQWAHCTSGNNSTWLMRSFSRIIFLMPISGRPPKVHWVVQTERRAKGSAKQQGVKDWSLSASVSFGASLHTCCATYTTQSSPNVVFWHGHMQPCTPHCFLWFLETSVLKGKRL